MFQGLFNYDNPVWRFIGKLGDLVLLNLLWLICCIPVFTAGAATTAVYYVTLKLVRDDDGSTIKSFFHSFTQNFKQATAIWLMILVAGGLLGFDLWFLMSGVVTVSTVVKTVMSAVFGAMTLILLFVTTYIFPLQARFYNTVKRTLFNAFFMSVRHLLQTISMSDSDIFSGTVSFSERIQRFLSALNKTGKTPVCPPAATLIHQSIKKADGDITVSELAARTGYSCRHISRIFTEYFGYSPKTFCRLLRFHHTLYEIFQDPHRNNSEFITQIGYSDQAHFQREFKTFMGETPRRFGRRLIQQKF